MKKMLLSRIPIFGGIRKKWLFAMKNFILLFFVFSLNLNANTMSQARVSLDLSNVNIKTLINEIESQTELGFLYNLNEIKGVKHIYVEANDETVKEILDRVLENTGLTYELDRNVIVIKPNPLPIKQEEKRKIIGTITDDTKVTLPGVSIVVKGTTNGVSTDFDGNFSLELPDDGPVTLLISFIGMESQEITVTNQERLDIVMSSSSEQLNEVTVTTGYQKIDRKLFAGSATKLKAEDAKIAGVSDVGRMLEGKVAGVSVQNVSGTFGAAPKIRVRGASSIYGDTKPLWVVDGVVLEDVVDVSPDQLSSGDVSTLISSSVAGLNAEDVATFQILKDASATALYGARAMNGVIVITTKKGVKGKSTVNVSSEFTVKAKPNYTQYDILNSQDQMSVFREMERKQWLGHAGMMRSKDGGVYFQMYDAINSYDGEYGLLNSPESRAGYLRKYEYANTDWFDLLFRNSLMQNHSVSLSGGSETASFYVSTSLLHDEGWTIADNVDRYTINMKGDFQLNDKLSVGVTTKGSIRNQTAPGTFSRSSDAVNGDYSREFDINPFSYALNTSRTIDPFNSDGSYRYNRMNYAKFNILDEFKNNYIDLNVLDLSISANLDYEFNKHLSYKFVGNLRYVKSTSEHKMTGKSNVANAYRAADDATIEDANKYLWSDPENPNARPVVVLPKGGFYNREDNMLKNFYIRNVVNYNNTFNETHLVNAMFGQEVRSADRNYVGFEGYGIQYDKGNSVFTDPNMMKKLSQSGFPYFGLGNSYDRFVAFFGNFAYSYKGKYTFNGTVRVDGSNKLGESNDSRWLPTWNLSGKWNVKEEAFMNDVEWISYLQVRATYGLTASMGPATNSKAVFRSNISVAPFSSENQNGLKVASLMNSELTWEKQYETNIGLDFGLFDNRISISTDFYRRKGFDLIAAIQTSGIGGEAWKLANYANMESQGFELSLNTKNIKTKDFSWNTNLTFAYNENEITKLYGQPNILSLTKAEGAPTLGGSVRGLYSIPFAGLDSKGIPTFYDKNGEKTQRVYFQDTDVAHLKYEGSIDPKVTGGISNRFSYKDFSLNIFCSYQFGNVIRLYPSFHAKYSDLDAMPQDMKNRWMKSGDENITNIPTIASKRIYEEYGSSLESTYNAYNYSDQRVAKGDFVRLKELSLSYKLPKTLINKIGINNASLKVQGTNLFLLYSDKALNGQDPEFFGNGGVALPVSRQYTLSLKLTL